jgi:hypothetical protein
MRCGYLLMRRIDSDQANVRAPPDDNASLTTERVMPSIFEISVAAFAIGMATNANVPNTAPAPKAEVTVQQPVTDATTPTPKPADVAAADCVAKQANTQPVCAQDPAQ